MRRSSISLPSDSLLNSSAFAVFKQSDTVLAHFAPRITRRAYAAVLVAVGAYHFSRCSHSLFRFHLFNISLSGGTGTTGQQDAAYHPKQTFHISMRLVKPQK